MSSVSLVIPLYNNERTAWGQLEECFRELKKTKVRFEILLCNDASSDETAGILAGFAKKHKQVKVITHKKNVGIAGTLRELYAKAVNDVTVLFSVDGEWNPEDVGKLIKKEIKSQADIVVGRRVNKQYTLGRQVVSWLYNRLPEWLYGVKTYDIGSIKAFRTELINKINPQSKSVFFEAEFLIKAQRLGYKIGVIDVSHRQKVTKTVSGVNVGVVGQAFLDLMSLVVQEMPSMVMVAVFVMGVVGLCFGYLGWVTKQPVSLDYNVPIAESIVSGGMWRLGLDNPYMYFPGSSHVILATFLLFKIPVNLFGLVSWVFLLWGCKKLGETFGLRKDMAVMLAASFGMTVAVVRTIADQSVDKWLCLWFVMSVILLEKLKSNWRHFFGLGMSMGMLVGTKYSGPLFAAAILIVYGKILIKSLNWKRTIILVVTVFGSGLIWYARNYFLTGSPMFPANLPFFKGYPNFTQQDWMLWKIPFEYPAGIIPLINAYISEYTIWTLAWMPIVWVVWKSLRHKMKIDSGLKRLIVLTATVGGVGLLLPITPAYKIELYHIISDMRYVYIFVLLQMLVVFLLAQRYGYTKLVIMVSLAAMIPAFSFVSYYPKIIMVGIIGLVVLRWSRDNKNEKAINRD
jgi:dolichol-phosphate mannosyltransferase